MGEFESGKWIVGLLLYFFMFFVLVFSFVAAADDLGLDHQVSTNDPGFANNQILPNVLGFCEGNKFLSCSSMVVTNATNPTCDSFVGCEWEPNPFFGDPRCQGILETQESCSRQGDQTRCFIVGCDWIQTDGEGLSLDTDNGVTLNTFTASIGVMTGFRADIGVPGNYRWIFSFLFFYIPFIMLLWSLYMAIPFIH